MKNSIFILLMATLILNSCGPTNTVLKSSAYSGIYEEKPLSLLIMPPINRSTNVEAKEFFHTTLNVPIANAGYYVVPPFLSMEILKRESAYDAEMFMDRPLNVFADIFGADMALFTIITKWDKSSLASKVIVEVEYIIKSTTSEEVLYNRKGTVIYNTAVSTGNSVLLNMLASAANTAATKYVDVARAANKYTFADLPNGFYGALFGLDGGNKAGFKVFKVKLPK
jgi:hypothetical protein